MQYKTINLRFVKHRKEEIMNKNGKPKTTCKAKKRIYIRPSGNQGILSTGISRVMGEKLILSVVYYDTVNDLLKKKRHDKTPLTYDEEIGLGSIIKRFFNGFECENDKAVCKSDTCLFAGNPDEWVKYEGSDNLCDLVYRYTEKGQNFNPPKCDAMGRRIPGDGFCNH